MGVPTICAEAPVAALHGRTESGGDRLLPDRQMAGALDQILEKQIIGALLDHANLELAAVQGQPRCGVDLVICSRPRIGRRRYICQGHILYGFEVFPSRRPKSVMMSISGPRK